MIIMKFLYWAFAATLGLGSIVNIIRFTSRLIVSLLRPSYGLEDILKVRTYLIFGIFLAAMRNILLRLLWERLETIGILPMIVYTNLIDLSLNYCICEQIYKKFTTFLCILLSLICLKIYIPTSKMWNGFPLSRKILLL